MVIQNAKSKEVNLLVINPNSSKDMTNGLKKMIDSLGYPETTKVATYTAQSGPDSINNEQDAAESAQIVFKDLSSGNFSTEYNGIVVACYSVHPLTRRLKSMIPATKPTQVVGIFESSLSVALSLLHSLQNDNMSRFGIVTTAKYWEEALTRGVLDFLGCNDVASCKRFKGVESTGLSAAELHTSPPSEVRDKLIIAVRKLVKDGDVGVICLGCAGMAGMDVIVREGCIEELGTTAGHQVKIVDGVKAGIALVDGLVRARP